MPKAEVYHAPDAGGGYKKIKGGNTNVATVLTTIQNSDLGSTTNKVEFLGATWDIYADGPDDNAGITYTSAANAYYNIRFVGTKIEVFGTKEPYGGILAWSIDGGTETRVDQYNAARLGKQKLFEAVGLSNAAHTLKVRVTGDRNPASTYGNVIFDYAVVTSNAGTVINDPTTPVTSIGSQSIPIGAGGWLTGMTIAPDGKMMTRADVFGFYDRTVNAGPWRQLATRDHIVPALDPQEISANDGCSGLAFAPTNTSVRYAMWHDGVWKSTDNGEKWSKVMTCEVQSNNDQVKLTGQRLVVDPVQPAVVYAATPRNGLQYSRNAGSTWTTVPTTTIPWTGDGGVTAVAVDATSASQSDSRKSIVAVGTWGNGCYRSTDGGTTWTKISSTQFVTVRQMSYAPNGDLICVVDPTLQSGSESYVTQLWRYRSGVWTNITPWPTGRAGASVAVDSVVSGRIAAAAHGGADSEGTVWRSGDYGSTWTKLIRQDAIATDIAWLQTQAKATKWMSVGQIAFDPINSGRLWMSEGIGMWYADITGTNLVWNSASAGVEELVGNVVVAAPGQTGVVVGSWDRAIFRQTSPKGNAYPVSILAGGDFNDCWHMDWASSDPTVLVADITNHQNWSPVFSGKSTDRGATWTPFTTRPFNSTDAQRAPGGENEWKTQAGRPFGGGQIAAASAQNYVWVPKPAYNGVTNTGYIEAPHYTKDGGATWTQCTFPAGTDLFSLCLDHHRRGKRLAADRVNIGTFYLVSADAICYRSTDGGANFVQVASAAQMGLTEYVLDFQPQTKTVPGKAGHIFQGTGWRQQGANARSKETTNLFKKSTDGGVTWTTVPGITSPEAIGFGKAISPSTYPTVYVVGWKSATEYGVFYSTNADTASPTWTAVPMTGPFGAYDQIYDLDGDKEVAGRLYASFAGQGFAVVDVISSATPTTNRAKIGVYKNYQAVGTNADGSTPTGIQPYSANVLGYEMWLGRKVDYVEEFQATNATDDHLAWPSYMSNYYTPSRMNGRLLALGATVTSRAPDGYLTARAYSWQQLADGAYDGGAGGFVWKNWAQRMVASGQANAISRGAHEFNLDIFAHRVMPGEQTAFIAAWRRWHGVVRANGFTGPIHWNPVNGDYRNIDATTAYPGDAYVDVIDLDMYDEYYGRGTRPGSTATAGTGDGPRSLAEQQANWSKQVNGNGQGRGLAYWRAFAVQHGKGMAFSEWGMGDYFNDGGLNYGGGDNEYYVEQMANFINDPAYPPGSPGGVVYHAFWEHNPDNGVQPNSAANPDSGRAIPVPKARAMFLAKFGGAATTSGVTSPAAPTLTSTAAARTPTHTWTTDFVDEFTSYSDTAQKWNLNRNAYDPMVGTWIDAGAVMQTPPPTENIEVKDSILYLRTKRKTGLARPFTGAMMTTSRPTLDAGQVPKYKLQENGTYFVEAKLWTGRAKGSWNAFWLLGDTYNGDALDVYGNPTYSSTYVQHWDGQTSAPTPDAGWPTGGEVDILEFPDNNVGDMDKPFVSAHWARTYNENATPPFPGHAGYRNFMGHPDSYAVARPDLRNSWHIWGCYRSPYLMIMYIDGAEICRWHRFQGGTPNNPATSGARQQIQAWDELKTPASVLWTKPMFLFLNNAMDQPGAAASWAGQGYASYDEFEEGELRADYVKVWKKT